MGTIMYRGYSWSSWEYECIIGLSPEEQLENAETYEEEPPSKPTSMSCVQNKRTLSQKYNKHANMNIAESKNSKKSHKSTGSKMKGSRKQRQCETIDDIKTRCEFGY